MSGRWAGGVLLIPSDRRAQYSRWWWRQRQSRGILIPCYGCWRGGDEKMDEPMFLVLVIRHCVTEWRCDQSRRVPSVPRALGPPLCFNVAVFNQSSSSMSCLLTRKGVGSKLRIGSLDLKMRGAARPSRSNSHDEPYISTGRSPALGPFPRDCSDWQLADDCSTRRFYTFAARVCEWLTCLSAPASLKTLGAVAEEPENNITSRRFTQTRGGTLTHLSIYTDGLTGSSAVDNFLFAVTVWDRHRAVVNWGGSKSAGQGYPRRARNLELSSISEEEKKHFREYKESVVKLQSLWLCACSVWWCHASDTHFYRFEISLFVGEQNSVIRMHSVPLIRCHKSALKNYWSVVCLLVVRLGSRAESCVKVAQHTDYAGAVARAFMAQPRVSSRNTSQPHFTLMPSLPSIYILSHVPREEACARPYSSGVYEAP